MTHYTDANPDIGPQAAAVIVDRRVPSSELLQGYTVPGEKAGAGRALFNKVKGNAIVYHVRLCRSGSLYTLSRGASTWCCFCGAICDNWLVDSLYTVRPASEEVAATLPKPRVLRY